MENAPDAENGLTGRDIIALNVLKKFAFIIEKIESFSLKIIFVQNVERLWFQMEKELARNVGEKTITDESL